MVTRSLVGVGEAAYATSKLERVAWGLSIDPDMIDVLDLTGLLVFLLLLRLLLFLLLASCWAASVSASFFFLQLHQPF